MGHMRRVAPHVPIILDAKRGDIGTTAEQYAIEAFERYGADAVTLSPFMGWDSVAPYLKYHGKGAFLLCRTSNPGGDDLQNQRLATVDGQPLLLIPGVGAQGGDAAATVKAGLRMHGNETTGPIIVSSSRAILYASKGDDFAEAARRVALQTRETLQAARG
jgi:orotidine-5'-phosphate decarboxylase